jgi:hypothetical protein
LFRFLRGEFAAGAGTIPWPRFATLALESARGENPLTSIDLTLIHFVRDCVFWETAFAVTRAYIRGRI